MGRKVKLAPAPKYHPLESFWDTEEDYPGPRCGHTLTAVAATENHGPRLILFGGATAIEGVGSGIRELKNISNIFFMCTFVFIMFGEMLVDGFFCLDRVD